MASYGFGCDIPEYFSRDDVTPQRLCCHRGINIPQLSQRDKYSGIVDWEALLYMVL